jgi:hypothetical protein
VNDNEPPIELHPDFPSGPDLALLRAFRDAVRRDGRALRLREIGCGVGIDGADVRFELGGRDLLVTIAIEDAPYRSRPGVSAPRQSGDNAAGRGRH